MKGEGASGKWEQEGKIYDGTSNKGILGMTEKYYIFILKI
jgi:hypothetical protein